MAIKQDRWIELRPATHGHSRWQWKGSDRLIDSKRNWNQLTFSQFDLFSLIYARRTWWIRMQQQPSEQLQVTFHLCNSLQVTVHGLRFTDQWFAARAYWGSFGLSIWASLNFVECFDCRRPHRNNNNNSKNGHGYACCGRNLCYNFECPNAAASPFPCPLCSQTLHICALCWRGRQQWEGIVWGIGCDCEMDRRT